MGSSVLCSLLIALCLSAVSFGNALERFNNDRQQQQNLRQHNDKATNKLITVVPNIPFPRIPSDQIEVTYIYPATDSNLGPFERMLNNTNPDLAWNPVLANSYEVELHLKDNTKVVNFIGISSDYRYAPIRYWQLRVGQSNELQTFQIPYVFSFQPILQPIQNSQGGGVFLLRFDFERPTEVTPTLIEISFYSGDTTPPTAMCVRGWKPDGAESSESCSAPITTDSPGYCGCAWSDYYIVPTLDQYANENPSRSLAHAKDCETLCNAFNNNDTVGYTFEPLPPDPVCRFPCKTCDKINWSSCNSCELGYHFHPDKHTCTSPTDIYNVELTPCGESATPWGYNYYHPPAFDLTDAGLVWFMINWPDDPWTGTFRVRIALNDYSNNTNFFAISFDNYLTTAFFCYDEDNCVQGFSNFFEDPINTPNNNGRIWISLKDGAISFGYGVYSFGTTNSQPLISPRNHLTFLREGLTELPSFPGMRPHIGFCTSSPPYLEQQMKLMNARIALPTLALDYVFNECAGTYNGDVTAYADEWPALLTPVPQEAIIYFKLSPDAGQSFRFTWTSGDAITQNDALTSFNSVAVYWNSTAITVTECQVDVCQPDQIIDLYVPPNSGRWFKASANHLSFGFRLPGEPSVAGDDESANFTLVSGDGGYQNLALFCNGYDDPLPQFEYIALSSPCGVPPTPQYGTSNCEDIHSDQQLCEQQCNWGVLEGDLNRTCVYGHWSQLVCNEPPPFCDPISAPDNGENDCPQTPNGGNCTQLCLQGVASGSEFRNCTDGEWTPLTCISPDLSCPMLDQPQYGSGQCDQTANGLNCTQACNFAVASGSPNRHCSDGVWTSLECAPYCYSLDGVDFGEGMCPLTAVGKTCTQTCIYGVLSGDVVRTCNSDQTWTSLVCNDPPIPCPAIMAPDLGSGDCPTTDFGQYCVQACDFSVAFGSVNRTCRDKGVWSPLICDVQKCPAIGPPQFGGGNCPVSVNNSECTQNCINEPKSGSTTRVCENGQWSPLTCNQLLNCPALGEPLHGEGECPETASGSYCNQTCVVSVQLGNTRRLCTNGVWSPLVCNGTFVPVLLFEWGESILSRFDDVFAQPVPKLYPQYVFICRTTGVKLGYVWGNNSYTLDSEFCTAAAHVTGLRGGVFDVHFTVDVLLPPDQRSPYPAVARNDVMSMFWGGKYPITYQIDRVHQGPTPAVNTPPSHHGYLLLEEEESRRNAGGTPVNTVVLAEVHRVQSTKSAKPQTQSQNQQSRHPSQSVLSPPRRFAENYRKQARGTLAPV